MKAVYILFFLAIAAPMLALIPTEQDPDAIDWHKAVDTAATSRRYGLRLAAARKVAAAGAPAVPAIADYVKKNGRNALPAALVDSIAREDTTAAPVVDQLLEWARDREFYWRSQAFLGLARRAAELPERRAELVELFRSHRDDAAWLVATHSRFGLRLLDAPNSDFDDPRDDPRTEGKLAALLLEHGVVTPLQPLLDALADERTFLGTPWGQHRGQDAAMTLKRTLGEAHPGAFEDKTAALTAIRDAIQAKWQQTLEVPAIVRDAEIAFTGGIEVLSCRNGDLYVQWTADGKIYEGIDARFAVALPVATWDALCNSRAALPLAGSLGAVVCDKMRVKWDSPALEINVAPAELPKAAADWFLELANALAAADKTRLATAVRSTVEQFALR